MEVYLVDKFPDHVNVVKLSDLVNPESVEEQKTQRRNILAPIYSGITREVKSITRNPIKLFDDIINMRAAR